MTSLDFFRHVSLTRPEPDTPTYQKKYILYFSYGMIHQSLRKKQEEQQQHQKKSDQYTFEDFFLLM